MRILGSVGAIVAVAVALSACTGSAGTSGTASAASAGAPATQAGASAATTSGGKGYGNYGAGAGASAAATASAAAPASVGASAPAAGSAVTIKDFAFGPAALTVTVGTSVTWTNLDSATHTVTFDTGNVGSDHLGMGATYSRTFTAAGTFAYHCAIHTSMTGTITVTN